VKRKNNNVAAERSSAKIAAGRLDSWTARQLDGWAGSRKGEGIKDEK